MLHEEIVDTVLALLRCQLEEEELAEELSEPARQRTWLETQQQDNNDEEDDLLSLHATGKNLLDLPVPDTPLVNMKGMLRPTPTSTSAMFVLSRPCVTQVVVSTSEAATAKSRAEELAAAAVLDDRKPSTSTKIDEHLTSARHSSKQAPVIVASPARSITAATTSTTVHTATKPIDLRQGNLGVCSPRRLYLLQGKNHRRLLVTAGFHPQQRKFAAHPYRIHLLSFVR